MVSTRAVREPRSREEPETVGWSAVTKRYGPPALAALVCLAAMALRLYRLAEPLMRWDEAWSVAHSSQSAAEIVTIASWEVHPPLFYLVLRPWLSMGRNLYLLRYLSVAIGVLAVPIAYRVTRVWLRKPYAAVLGAALTAAAPGLVYYSQVLRMYPLVVVWVLLAVWALLGWLNRGRVWALVALVLAGTAALYTLYYSAFALLALFAYGLIVGRRRRGGLAIAAALTGLAFVPWLVYAGGGLVERMLQAAPVETIMPVTVWGLVASVWTALTFDFGSNGWASLVVLAVIATALVANWPGRVVRRRLLLPVLGLLLTVSGIVLGSGFYFFAPRLLTPAAPFLILILAWALWALLDRSGFLLALGCVALVVAYWPTSTGFVYEKSLEVSGEFDPHEYHREISGQAGADDVIFFNELALAGWYEMDRDTQDPSWTYALRWTPIVEPMPQVISRVEEELADHPRLWFVLYKGSFGPGRELKDWLDGALYPASMTWGTDSLFLSYVRPDGHLQRETPMADFGGKVRLEAAEFGEQSGPAGQVPVVLHWRALEGSLPDLRVVLQAWDESGNVLAQRDVRPANWERPAYDWVEGELVEDRHGLVLVGGDGTPVHLAVSVYEAGTGTVLSVSDLSFLELGTVGDGRSE